MNIIKLFLIGMLIPTAIFAETLVYSDFEDGTMDNWVPKMSNECWEVSSSSPLEGLESLKAADLGIGGSIYAYTNVTYDLSSYTYEWKFMMDSREPTSGSTGTKFWFWLAADSSDFESSDTKGYLVGVQYNSINNDNLSVWKVNGSSDRERIIESSFDVGGSPFAVKVTRSSGGVWTLYYNESTSFDSMTFGGTSNDTSITSSLAYSGVYFTTATSYSGDFKFDACTIEQTTGSIPLPIINGSEGTNISVYVDEEVTFDVTASVAAISYGGLFSTNKPSGSTFVEQTDDFPLSTTFSWTPDTLGSYTAVFTSTNETGATDLIVNIEVEEVPKHDLWINEFHYDNDSTDVNEGIEIAGKAGIDLSNYTIYAYNGSGGVVYDTESLTGTIPDENNTGYGAVWFAISGLQNGPDGLALVKDDPEEVFYFISYEGSFEATEGPANGMTSEDVGVTESTTSPIDYSLQLIGSGAYYEDFTWSGPSLYSHGLINVGQNLKSLGTVFFIK